MIGTSGPSASSQPVAQGPLTGHGFVDGEIILRLTPDGERAVAASVGKPAGRLRFGVASLDRLNAKYHASAITPVEGQRGTYRLQLAADANVLRAAEEYGRDPAVAAAEPHYLMVIPRAPEAPLSVRTRVGP